VSIERGKESRGNIIYPIGGDRIQGSKAKISPLKEKHQPLAKRKVGATIADGLLNITAALYHSDQPNTQILFGTVYQ
jgi:hypothetical protein